MATGRGGRCRPGPRRWWENSEKVVHVDEVDADAAATESAHDGAQSACGATVAADHLAEVVGVDPHLEHPPTTEGGRSDVYVIGVVDDALHEVLESLLEHAQASVGSVDAAAASAAAASPESAFFSDFFALGVIASPFGSSAVSLAAASKS